MDEIKAKTTDMAKLSTIDLSFSSQTPIPLDHPGSCYGDFDPHLQSGVELREVNEIVKFFA